MSSILVSAGKLLAKGTALKAGRSLLRPRNLKKLGLGVGATAAASISYVAYNALIKK